MIKNLVTVVCSTSPHRFGSSVTMLLLNHSIIQNSQFKDCKFIICADGLNPKSNYKNKEEEYEEYLSNINKEIPTATLLTSKHHIGLTKNYFQAWESKEIKTPFVLLLNHDTVFHDDILSVDIESLLNNFPDFVNLLMFPRATENGIDKDWWRNIPLSEHPEYKKNPSWEKCRISFGNQDNCCLIRTESFKDIIENFYNAENTHFIEDSIQDYLVDLELGDIDGWDKFKGCMYTESNNLHLDGQSKAGNWRQDNCRGGENVWSNGALRNHNISMFKLFFSQDPSLEKIYYKFLHEVFEDYQTKCHEQFQKFHAFASQTLALKKILNKQEPNQKNIVLADGRLPYQSDNFLFHLKIEPFQAEILWEDVREEAAENSSIIMKLFKVNKNLSLSMLRNGGHAEGRYKFAYQDLNIEQSDSLRIELKEFIDRKATSKQSEITKSFNLSFCQFTKDKILLFSEVLPMSEDIKLNIRKNDGSKIKYSIKNGVYEILLEDLGSCESIVGFFYTEDQEGVKSQSWTFECSPFGVDFTSLSSLYNSYGEFIKDTFGT